MSATDTDRADVIIIGAGIAGASLAAQIAHSRSVIIAEAESNAGYHSTGRSVAFWTESYGGPDIQPLTSASRAWLAKPPEDISCAGFLQPRGALTLGKAGDQRIDQMVGLFAERGVAITHKNGEEIGNMLPGVRDAFNSAAYEPDCCDIDVARLHEAYLRCAKRHGARLCLRTGIHEIVRNTDGWTVYSGTRRLQCKILVNASGAWADNIAHMAGIAPIGIQPLRRTVVQLRTCPVPPADMPLILDIEGRFYFKPDNGRLWLSPHDETVSAPCDAAPEEIDVATAIARFQQVVDWRIEAVERRWAGLRSFAPDRLPVIGPDAADDAFFWFAGQGGYGIQTAPAAAKLAAHIMLGGNIDPMVANIDINPYLASRFGRCDSSYVHTGKDS